MGKQEEEQCDQGLQCLPLRLHFLDALLYGKPIIVKFLDNYSNFFGCPNF